MKDAENEDLRGQDLGIGELDSVQVRLDCSYWLTTGQLSAKAGLAGVDEALVADQPSDQADQDWCGWYSMPGGSSLLKFWSEKVSLFFAKRQMSMVVRSN